jgi:glucose-6-phosphate 1-epimerase
MSEKTGMSKHQVKEITLGELHGWQINDGQAELLVLAQGAQVVSYTRTGQPPLIWLNDQSHFIKGKAVRAGVPVCWPWFGNLAKNPQAVQAMRVSDEAPTAHGLVRTLEWTLKGIEDTEAGVRIELTLPQAEQGFPGWDHPAALSLTIVMGDSLKLSLTTRNIGAQTLVFSQALHSYFSVGDVRQISVESVAGLSYMETVGVEDWEQRSQTGPLKVTGETDRVYLATPEKLTIEDPQRNRRIVLSPSGSKNAVIWNPWIDRAANLDDMANDGWQQMFCIETANVLDDVVTLAPGAEHTMSVAIASEAL